MKIIMIEHENADGSTKDIGMRRICECCNNHRDYFLFVNKKDTPARWVNFGFFKKELDSKEEVGEE